MRFIQADPTRLSEAPAKKARAAAIIARAAGAMGDCGASARHAS
jgi:hypothetical protein